MYVIFKRIKINPNEPCSCSPKCAIGDLYACHAKHFDEEELKGKIITEFWEYEEVLQPPEWFVIGALSGDFVPDGNVEGGFMVKKNA